MLYLVLYISLFMYPLVGGYLGFPFVDAYIGDLTLHLHFVFITLPLILIVLFIGTILEEVFDLEYYDIINADLAEIGNLGGERCDACGLPTFDGKRCISITKQRELNPPTCEYCV